MRKIILSLSAALLASVSKDCVVGAILNSDMSCSADVVSGKTPIGVVFDRENKLAMGLEESYMKYSETFLDFSLLNTFASNSMALTDMDGKKNTNTILAYCKANGKSCPAFEYVSEYKTEGTKAGDWYLPALGELFEIYYNRDEVNAALERIGATRLADHELVYYGSSSMYDGRSSWWLLISDSGHVFSGGFERLFFRPVLAF